MTGSADIAALTLTEAGKLIALGTSSARQTTLLADVPPLERTLRNFDAQAWQAVVAPAGTPRDVAIRLNGEINRILASVEFRRQLASFGMEPVPLAAEEFASFLKSDIGRWADVIKQSGAKVD